VCESTIDNANAGPGSETADAARALRSGIRPVSTFDGNSSQRTIDFDQWPGETTHSTIGAI
jgi:hypothetical protein